MITVHVLANCNFRGLFLSGFNFCGLIYSQVSISNFKLISFKMQACWMYGQQLSWSVQLPHRYCQTHDYEVKNTVKVAKTVRSDGFEDMVKREIEKLTEEQLKSTGNLTDAESEEIMRQQQQWP